MRQGTFLVLVWAHFNILPTVIKNLHTLIQEYEFQIPPGLKCSLLDCFLCLSKLLNSEDILTHFEEIDPNNFNYQCETCNRKFLRLFDTRYHQCKNSPLIPSSLITQNPVLRFKICFKNFTQQNGLTNHVKSDSSMEIILSSRGIPIERLKTNLLFVFF